ncbi:Uma2 family endonuclease [Streptomyces sp. TE5632]
MRTARDYGLDGDHEWPRPPEGGWTADDLDELPNLPRRTELIDGSLVFASPQTRFRARTVSLPERALVEQAPDACEVYRNSTVTLDKRKRPEPDVMVARADADTGPKRTRLLPGDVTPAAEVVSDDSEDRDRETKPRNYAAAGVRHFWRVEENDGLPAVYVYELDPATKAYVPVGIFHNRLKVTVPFPIDFPIDIDLTAVDRRR